MSNNRSLPQIVPSLGLGALSLREPAGPAVDSWRARHASASFSYPHIGGTRDGMPEGWATDAYSVVLGGPDPFARGVDALSRWVMFDLDWVTVHPESGQQTEDLVTFHTRHFGVWMKHSCRVVYRIDEPDQVGFGYGTLAGHAVAGEEQFLVHRAGDEVRYSVRKFSKLAHPLVRFAGSIAVRLQHRFSVESGQRMQEEVLRAP